MNRQVRTTAGCLDQQILLAEDDVAMRRLIALALRKDGYRVVEARNGMEMLDTLAPDLVHPVGHAPADLIISDFHLPGVTGLSVLAGLRDLDWTTPFILITAFGGPDVQDSALRYGASAYFEKPFDIDDLRRKVHELTGNHYAANTPRPRCSLCGGSETVPVDDLPPDFYVCLHCLHNRELGGET